MKKEQTLYVVKRVREIENKSFDEYLKIISWLNSDKDAVDKFFDDASFLSLRDAKKLAKVGKKRYCCDYIPVVAEEEFHKVNEKYPLVLVDCYIINDKKFTKEQYDKYLIENNLVEIDGYVQGIEAQKVKIYKVNKGEKVRIGYSHCDNRYLIKKEIDDRLRTAPENISKFITNEKYVRKDYRGYYNSCSYLYLKEDIDAIMDELKKDHKPYVIKGTDHPFYFKVFGKLLGSETKIWYEHLKNEYGILEEFMLEEVKS